MIRDIITREIGKAMKSKDKVRLSTLRLLSSALNYEFIEKQRELKEDEEIAVVKREIKRRKEAMEAYLKVNQKERADMEAKELTILEEFLPEGASEEEVKAVVNEAILKFGASPANFGKIMGFVMGKLGSKVDGSVVSQLVRQKLS